MSVLSCESVYKTSAVVDLHDRWFLQRAVVEVAVRRLRKPKDAQSLQGYSEQIVNSTLQFKFF